jgi:hypothetical protein
MAGEWNHTSGKWNGDAEDKGEWAVLSTNQCVILEMYLPNCFLLQVSKPLRTTGSLPFRLSTLSSATRTRPWYCSSL